MTQPRVGHLTVDDRRASLVERVEVDGELVRDVWALDDEEGWVLQLVIEDNFLKEAEPLHRIEGRVDVFFHEP